MSKAQGEQSSSIHDHEILLMDQGELQNIIDRLDADKALVQGELSAIEASLKAPAKEREAQISARANKHLIRLLAVAVAVTGVGAAVYLFSIRGIQAEDFRGAVVSVAGSAPVAVGERCTASLQPNYRTTNAWLRVDCGGLRLYGLGSFGYLNCETLEGRAVRCLDEETIAEGGDPRVDLDLRARRLVIDDGDRWSVAISLER